MNLPLQKSEIRMAGKCWVYSVIKRNRALGFNKSDIIFCITLETLMAKHNFPSNRTFNVDKTDIRHVQKCGKM